MVSSLLLIQTMLLYVLVQVHVPDTQWSQTNWNVGVWNKKRFTAGPYKELSGSCLKALNAPKGFSCVLMVVNIFHLLEREDVLHLQNNLGNVHQILLLNYLREELCGAQHAPRAACWACLGRSHGVLLCYIWTSLLVQCWRLPASTVGGTPHRGQKGWK